MYRNSSRSKSAGFTLIELLVVIAIIAILAAILFPVFAQAREKARAISCLSNAKQVGLGLYMYVEDYDELMPSAFAAIPPINGGTVAVITFEDQIDPYVKNQQLYKCPSDGQPRNGASFWNGNYGNAVTGVGKYIRSYGYVGNISTQQNDLAGNGANPDPNTGMSAWGQGYSIAGIDQPSDTIAIVEAAGYSDGGSGNGGFQDGYFSTPWGDLFTNCDTYKLSGRMYPPVIGSADDWHGTSCTANYEANNNNQRPSTIHMGKGNYMFADGHAKAQSWGALRSNDFFVFKRSKPTQTFSP